MSQIDQRQMLPMGTMLDHRYRIIRYLASGGFGNTYVAEDTRLGGQVAVKEFFMRGTNHRSTDGTTVEVSNDTNTPVFTTQLKKFKREARRIFELQNEHIIQVFDLFDTNGTSYYVMKLINGVSLAKQTLSEDDAHDVIMQVLDALETMHNAGLYHLDVKPGNIMRDANGHCTLIDFGASKQLSADERNTLSSSTMAYTPGYAPVEQVAQQSKTIGPWTDFYALGATLYQLVTGTTPPEVSVTDSAPDGRQFPYPETVSTTLRQAISTLMNPIYTLRPQTADEVRALLEGKSQPQPENTVYTTPTPDTTNEETHYDGTPTPHVTQVSPVPPMPPESPDTSQSIPDKPNSFGKKLWYLLLGSVVLAFIALGIITIVEKCEDDKRARMNQGITNEEKVDEDVKTATPAPQEWDEPTSYKHCPDNNHPHMIDLGLPSGTKWACCNVDANFPEDFGGHYAWGETSTKSSYDPSNYKYCDGSLDNCHNIGASISGTQYDVAHVKWGKTWQMPTLDQCKELYEKCYHEWTTVNGVNGRRFTGLNGESIFLPAAGSDGVGDNSYAYYWSSTQHPSYSYDAYRHCFGSDEAFGENFCCRYAGQSVRPVCN